MSPVAAGGVDWLERWASMQAAAARSRGAEREVDPWVHRAARFGQRDDAAGREPALPGSIAGELTPHTTVIDIGAGTGRHALVFARLAARVVAVEPSAAMRAVLEQRAEAQQLRGLVIVPEPWPLAEPLEPADLVFSSHVLYGVVDLAAFVTAMSATARRTCALLLGLRAPSAVLDPLRQLLNGTPRAQRPAALEALAALHQLGLEASLEILHGSERTFTVRPCEEDLDDLARRLHLSPGPDARRELRQALDHCAPLDAAGAHVLGTTGPNALLCWPGRADRGPAPAPPFTP